MLALGLLYPIDCILTQHYKLNLTTGQVPVYTLNPQVIIEMIVTTTASKFLTSMPT